MQSKKSIPVTRWWWVRHAPVACEAYIYGHADLACDCSDVTTFTALAARLPEPGVVVCSHLFRTRQTFAALVATGWTAPPKPLMESAFAEQAFGTWEGATWKGLRAAAEPHYAVFWASPFTVRPPGGESFLDVMARVRGAMARLSRTHAGRDIVAIAHAGSIRAALSFALDLTPNQVHAITVDPLSVTRFDCLGKEWQIRRVNAWP